MKRHIRSELRVEVAPTSFISWAFSHFMKNRGLVTKIIYFFSTKLSILTKMLTLGENVVWEGRMEKFHQAVS